MLFKVFILQMFIVAQLSCLTAQMAQIKRIELEIDAKFMEQGMESFDELGVIVKSRSKFAKDGKHTWVFDKYNNELSLEVTKSIKLDKNMTRVHASRYEEDFVNFFFNKRQDEFIIHSLNAERMDETQIRGRLPKSATGPFEMEVLGDYCYFDISIRNEPFVYIVNRYNGENKLISLTVPGYNKKRTFLWDMQVLKVSKELMVFAKVHKQGNLELFVTKFNLEAEDDARFNLSGIIDKNLISVSATKINEKEYMFVGTYSSFALKSSHGIYFIRVLDQRLINARFHLYSELDDFFKYLPERKQEKIEKRIDKKERKGKQLINNYLMASHDLLPNGEGYIYIGEAHYETEKTETYTTFDAQGNPITRTRKVFDGYRYTHAVIAKFDQNGDILWDRIFELKPSYKPHYHKRFIALNERDYSNDVKMMYPSTNHIYSKTFDTDGNILSEEKSKVLRDDYKGNLEFFKRFEHETTYWYDHYFLSFGHEFIRDVDKKGINKGRRLHFLVKMEL